MIPKKIHYCWFGRNPKPKLAEKCIRSWKRYCPDYEIIEWNEDNYDLSSAPLYVSQAYEAKKWAFVSDYVRLDVVYQHGGIYLDTDVEVIQKLNSFLRDSVYFGFEDEQNVNTGVGFGAEKGSPILLEMMEEYNGLSFFLSDGNYDRTACPIRNTAVLVKHGLKQDGSEQYLDNSIHIYSPDYFCPLDFSGIQNKRTSNTISIHWYCASWFYENKEQEKELNKRKRSMRIDYFLHAPNRLAIRLLGLENYEKLKTILKNR